MSRSNQPEVEDVTCCLCGSSDRKLLYLGKDRLLGHAGAFPIVQCRTCGMVYQSPRPRDMEPYYEGDYMCYDGKPTKFNPIIKRKRRFSPSPEIEFYGSARAYCEILHTATAGLPIGRRLLDVGCGSGDFLAAAQALGWDVHGIEPNPQAAAKANARLRQPSRQAGQAVATGFLEPGRYAEGEFDVITLWHVIEHLDHPVDTVREVRRALKPGGLCLIQTPRWGSLEARLFGRYWSGLDSPRHLWIFSDHTIRALMDVEGFHIRAMAKSNSYPLYAMSTKFWLNEKRAGCGDRAFGLMHRPNADRIGAALTWLLVDWGKWASNLTVVAQKLSA